MSLFRREAEDPQPAYPYRQGAAGAAPAAAPRDRAVTRIAEGTRVRGEITGATELLVEGEVEGEIRLDARAVVGPAGRVRGQVAARSVLVAGTVEGDVRGAERVEVGASGKLEGDIVAPRVTIAEGAFFKGKVEMSGGGAGGSRSGEGPGEVSGQAAEEAPGAAPDPGQAARPEGEGG